MKTNEERINHNIPILQVAMFLGASISSLLQAVRVRIQLSELVLLLII